MAVHMDKSWWRTSLAIGILPFAALGVAGCDNSDPAEEEAASVATGAAGGDGTNEEETVVEETAVEGDSEGEAG